MFISEYSRQSTKLVEVLSPVSLQSVIIIAMKYPCIVFTFPTVIFRNGVSGFVTGCPYVIWYRGLTNRPLHVSHFFTFQIYSNKLDCIFDRMFFFILLCEYILKITLDTYITT